MAAGFFSGFLGLGGGIILIPGLVFLFNLPVKKAFGTSLLVIVFLVTPGAVIHFLLGHVDIKLSLLLIAGTIPGAYLGSKFAIAMEDRTLKLLFGILLASVAVYFGIYEALLLL